jgi:hypothetical protein
MPILRCPQYARLQCTNDYVRERVLTDREINFEILDGLTVFEPPRNSNAESFRNAIRLSVCIYVCMYVRLAASGTVAGVLFVFSIQGLHPSSAGF